MKKGLTRRQILRCIPAGALILLGCGLEERTQEKPRVISDPSILEFYDSLWKQLKEGTLTDYQHQDTFEPYLAVWREARDFCREHGISIEGAFEMNFLVNKEAPDGLKDRFSKLYFAYLASSQTPDNLDGVKDKAGYIKENRLSYEDVIQIINKARISLFGEQHGNVAHSNLEMRLLGDISHDGLACTCEPLQVQRKDILERFLGGGDESGDELVEGVLGPEETKKELKVVRGIHIPVIPADVYFDLDKRRTPDNGPFFPDERTTFIRESVIARQMIYAQSKGYRIFGWWGDGHTRPEHLPRQLKTKGVTPLVVSGSNFSEEVYDVAMEVSGNKDIFFRRGEHITYVAPRT